MVRVVESRVPKFRDMAVPGKMGSKRITKFPTMLAAAVSSIGLARTMLLR